MRDANSKGSFALLLEESYLLRWEEFDYVSYQDRTAHQPPYPGMG